MSEENSRALGKRKRSRQTTYQVPVDVPVSEDEEPRAKKFKSSNSSSNKLSKKNGKQKVEKETVEPVENHEAPPEIETENAAKADSASQEQDYELQRARLQEQLTENEKLCNELVMRLTEAEEKLQAKSHELTQKVSATVESELHCSICREVFIKAVTLSCSHTFCEFCIDQWKKTKEQCPVCRKPITSSVSSLALDNFITQYMTTQSADVQEKRNDTMAERIAASLAEPIVPTATDSDDDFNPEDFNDNESDRSDDDSDDDDNDSSDDDSSMSEEETSTSDEDWSRGSEDSSDDSDID